jgi:hypothetical protein
MQNYDQSDQDTETEGVSSAASEPAADNDYDEEGEEEDDEYHGEYNNDRDENTLGNHSFSNDQSLSNDHVDPKLATLLNGPQWQPANPNKRRTARVDYNEKKLAQAPTRNPKQTAKVSKKC